MIFDGHSYRVLIVSSSDRFTSTIMPMLSPLHYQPAQTANSVAAARRSLLENHFDMVIINSPLSDDPGFSFAMDACSRKLVVLLMVKAEIHEEVNARVSEYGVFTLPKPTSASMIETALRWMNATRERLRKMEQKTSTLEEKMEEIRLVNRAKWILIEQMKMSENDAHHYIEKQAMNRCVSKREIAESILNTYQ